MEKLTQQEEEVMLYIWELNDCNIKHIVDKFDEPRPPYTTVASIVKNLERKRYLKSSKKGKTYFYSPLIEQQTYKKKFMKNVVLNYFQNSYKDVVSFFAKEQKISTEELKDIINLIEKNDKKD